MNLLKTIALILTLTFCTNCGVVYSHDIALGKKPLNVDESGMMVKYGGQLINKRQSLFCTHWDILGEEISFIARNGKAVNRTVVKIDKLGFDLCIVTFDEDLDPKQHWFAPVADIDEHTVVTIFRYDQLMRGPIVVEVENDFYYDQGMFDTQYNTFLCMPGRSIRPGDSGKGWYALIDGKVHLVGINSYISLSWRQEPVRAFSPEVGEIYEKYQKELKDR